jgi:hypothetical protein
LIFFLKKKEVCNKLAKKGAEKTEDDNFDLTIPDSFDIQGAKLLILMQVIAYRGLREISTTHEKMHNPNKP